MIKKGSHLIVTVFGVGHMPFAPGTFGSLVGLFLGASLIFLTGATVPPLFRMILLISVLSMITVPLYLKTHPKKKDPPEVVIDEVLGQLIALLPCGMNLNYMMLSFILFRIFDIWKPWPVSWADRLGGSLLKNAIGLLLDDVLAGLLAAGVLLGLQAFAYY
ncbi:phosphatidylglycerophosphatase A [Alphaproteobacteria bacterium]|nr:phosphatidylglycerophosphatase A [Alphaproteobacteria bacterium]